MRFVFLVLILTLVSAAQGCRFQDDCQDDLGIARVHADPSFDGEEQASILRAAARWNAFTRRTVILVDDRRLEDTCTVVDSPLEYVAPDKFFHAQGVQRGDSGNMEIAANLSCGGEARSRAIPCFEAVVMHEMGHLLGMEHVMPGQRGVMQKAGCALDFTDADLAQCLVIGLCV